MNIIKIKHGFMSEFGKTFFIFGTAARGANWMLDFNTNTTKLLTSYIEFGNVWDIKNNAKLNIYRNKTNIYKFVIADIDEDSKYKFNPISQHGQHYVVFKHLDNNNDKLYIKSIHDFTNHGTLSHPKT